jgi:anti-sigma regulatory factor (Ser/Thr protein kinase)
MSRAYRRDKADFLLTRILKVRILTFVPYPRDRPLMCRYDSKIFGADVSQSRAARRWIVGVLGRWGLELLAEELELAGSELVTNALLHTRSGFEVTIAVCGGSVELAVRDRDPRQPVLRPPRLDLLADVESIAKLPTPDPDEADLVDIIDRHPSLHVGPSGSIDGGRGLLIVDAIADEWGVASHAGGKGVWLRLPVPRWWPYLHECTCDKRAARTPSGHSIRHQHGEWDASNHVRQDHDHKRRQDG